MKFFLNLKSKKNANNKRIGDSKARNTQDRLKTPLYI